jgi:hypothetical protein
MAYASQSGRARTSAKSPQAHAICDRCGFRYNHIDLKYQYEWRGPVLQNIQLLVCKSCLDIPQEQLRSIAIPADPVPIMNARPQDFTASESDYRAVSAQLVTDPVTGIPIPSTTLRVTQDCDNRTLIPYGEPEGLDQNAIMPLQIVDGVPTHYGVPLPVLSVSAIGTVVTVTCSAVHNLHPDNQISVEGLTAGNGFFSIQVPTATMFTYRTIKPVSPQLTSTTRIVTAKVGLPLGTTELSSG